MSRKIIIMILVIIIIGAIVCIFFSLYNSQSPSSINLPKYEVVLKSLSAPPSANSQPLSKAESQALDSLTAPESSNNQPLSPQEEKALDSLTAK